MLGELQILSHAPLMPTSKLGPVPVRDALLNQALPQLLKLLGQLLHQRELRGLHQLPLEVLRSTQTGWGSCYAFCGMWRERVQSASLTPMSSSFTRSVLVRESTLAA